MFKRATDYKLKVIPIKIEYNRNTYSGEAIPIPSSCHDGVCFELDITLNKEHLGIIRCTKEGWRINNVKDQGLIDKIGEEIFLWFE